jgi:hypothetical protein
MQPGPEQPAPSAPDATATAGEAIAAWKVGGRAYLVVRVRGDGPNGEEVEYLGSVSEEALARLAPAEQRLALLEAVRVERDRTRALAAVQVRELVGPVQL